MVKNVKRKPIIYAKYIIPPNKDWYIQLDGQLISVIDAQCSEGIAWQGFDLYNFGKKSKLITMACTKNTVKFTIKNLKEKKS